MKKRKIGWLLNVATIALCVCAIAIGVYSAKTASLSISGSISFNSPDCVVKVTGSYTACLNSEDKTRTTKELTETTVGGDSGTNSLNITDALCFGSLATDDNGDEIVFNLTIENLSPYRITVKAPAPTLADSEGVTITSVTCTSNNEKFTLQAKGSTTGTSATIQLKYKLEDIDSADEINDAKFNISLNFAKWSVADEMYIADIGEVNYNSYSSSFYYSETNNRLCITMGHSVVDKTDNTDGTDGTTETSIQWYAFAVKGVDTGNGYVYNNTWYANGTSNGNLSDRWYSLEGIEFTEDLEMKLYNTSTMQYDNEISAKGQTFWFIQQYVTAGGYNTTGGYSLSGVQFNSDSDSNNYQESDIYEYLTDTTTETNYLSATGIKDTDVYSGISKRAVSEDYTINYSETYTCSFTSKLWLISLAELGLINKANTANSSYVTKTAGINGDKYTTTNTSGFGAYWWLRSAKENSSDGVHYVDNSGTNYMHGNMTSRYGVRAAFEVSIPA